MYKQIYAISKAYASARVAVTCIGNKYLSTKYEIIPRFSAVGKGLTTYRQKSRQGYYRLAVAVGGTCSDNTYFYGVVCSLRVDQLLIYF